MKRKPPPVDAPEGPFNAAFAGLAGRLPRVAPGEPAPPPGAPPPAEARPVAPPVAKPERPPPARAVVRLERKGRGGKEATVVDKLGLPPAALGAWADAMKRALGCGGSVERDAIALQGDQRERARRWLEERGVRKVTIG